MGGKLKKCGKKIVVIGRNRDVSESTETAVFSRARWCFRQCAWPARRHARKNHWRARESTGLDGKEVVRAVASGGSGRGEIEI